MNEAAPRVLRRAKTQGVDVRVPSTLHGLNQPLPGRAAVSRVNNSLRNVMLETNPSTSQNSALHAVVTQRKLPLQILRRERPFHRKMRCSDQMRRYEQSNAHHPRPPTR